MIKHSTIEKLQHLKLQGFIDVANEMTAMSANTITLSEGLDLMVEREIITRDNRRLKRLLKAARLRYPNACVANIDYQQARKFNVEQLRELTHCRWITQRRNLILSGPTGVGKSYLACALGQQACQMMITVRYYRVVRLDEILRLSHADGSYAPLLEQLAKISLLILDDWGIDQLDRQARRDLLEVLEDRSERTSTIITTQLPLEQWHQFIGDDTIADAICDRLVNNAHRIDVSGESMRKAKSLTHVEQSVVS